MAENVKRERAEPVAVGPPRRRQSRAGRLRAERTRRRRRAASLFTLTLLVAVLVAAAVVGFRLWQGMSNPDDFAGDGVSDVVVQVHEGDSTTAVGQTLAEANVVANGQAFVDAAQGNTAIAAIQPGFYRMRTEIPAASAVTKLADPDNRVGKLTIPEGRQLDDVADVKTGDVTEGIFSMISAASCIELNDEQKCVPVADLKTAAGSATLEALKVPEWATKRVTEMGAGHRRIEGLIAPGTWNVDPSAPAQDILASLIGTSTTHYVDGGLLDTAQAMAMSPYDILVVGSLLQKEATPEDFAKVARVIYNRLAEPQRLEFDSTVNYPLDRQEVATTNADRLAVTPWNTYASAGLPATPIGSPGDPA
ncbi:MAG TPA: endolytic transglycosylase MltG, partial [Mycobacterium sp.]|nr:endolytic transglycosylase MltG [Mycobacterium sp.]